jgi:hypothetical protein
MAFDFCFEMFYPSATEDKIRNCIYDYSRYTKLSEQIFSQYVREKMQKNKPKKE